jgi:AMP-activated protein kinase-like protein
MEMRRFVTVLLLLVFPGLLLAQRDQKRTSFTVREGRMYVYVNRHIDKPGLNAFIDQYELSDLDLPQLLFGRSEKDREKLLYKRLEKMGWRVEIDNRQGIVLSKPITGMDDLGNPGRRIDLAQQRPNAYDLFPPQNDNLVYGYNRFPGKFPFRVKDSLVVFYLKGHSSARHVALAGSFTNWQHAALAMSRTDSGWIAVVPLGPGKYWYKFIIDGGWTIDNDNYWKEDDGMGNTNSVYYKTNTIFTLPGFAAARGVYLAGSFNKWNPSELPMTRGADGWSIDIYLKPGTYTYKFVVDGKWYEDPNNSSRLPDEHRGSNSVLQLGRPHYFELKGYGTARSVALAGSFNFWRSDELILHKTAEGWELPYALGPGDYEYKFVVDGKWITDPGNPLFVYNRGSRTTNSYLILEPNHTFKLDGFADARAVYLAGDFNDWTPNSLKMRREGNAWVFPVYLTVGKHLYKFVVDGRWIRDPANPLWEENDEHTGNSIIWMEPQQ